MCLFLVSICGYWPNSICPVFIICCVTNSCCPLLPKGLLPLSLARQRILSINRKCISLISESKCGISCKVKCQEITLSCESVNQIQIGSNQESSWHLCSKLISLLSKCPDATYTGVIVQITVRGVWFAAVHLWIITGSDRALGLRKATLTLTLIFFCLLVWGLFSQRMWRKSKGTLWADHFVLHKHAHVTGCAATTKGRGAQLTTHVEEVCLLLWKNTIIPLSLLFEQSLLPY